MSHIANLILQPIKLTFHDTPKDMAVKNGKEMERRGQLGLLDGS